MRPYYNHRHGNAGERPKLSLAEASKQLVACYRYLDEQGYLQKAFGYYCVDAHDVPGEHGADIRTHFYITTTIKIDGAVEDFIRGVDEVGLFTLLEFLHDYVAKPDEGSGRFHTFSGCGWHFNCRSAKFDIEEAREEWRDKVNVFLKFYEDGFELSADGEVVRLAPDGVGDLLAQKAPTASGDKNIAKIANAVRSFRRGLSTREERKQAVRDLVDVLEFYRPRVKEHLLKGDERDLFQIANNFAIRHHHANQQDDYSDAWLSWLFYLYLSSVHLVLELVHTGNPAVSDDDPDGDDDEIPF